MQEKTASVKRMRTITGAKRGQHGTVAESMAWLQWAAFRPAGEIPPTDAVSLRFNFVCLELNCAYDEGKGEFWVHAAH